MRGTLVLVEVERLPRQTRIPRRLWLWWRGPGQPDLTVLWRAYVHRFDLEHTYRFCKQTLNWTTPRALASYRALGFDEVGRSYLGAYELVWMHLQLEPGAP